MTIPQLNFTVLGLIFFAAGSLAVADEEARRAGDDFFENKIRPVLVSRCFKCHAGENREGKLRLDRRDEMLKGGQSGRVVLPGDPNGSLLIRALRRTDKDLQMPPDDADQLTAAEVQNFVAWVAMGLPFPGTSNDGSAASLTIDFAKARQFWSLQPVQKRTPPQVNSKHRSHNSIDAFVLAKLQDAGMLPSPVADKRSLLRRVTYDLTGLPPTSAEIAAFVADSSPTAFEKLVERLLDSKQYGVHWARHWLDVARYSDTRWVGAGEDRRWPFAYTYRDWVIDALNQDLPYDRFVTLQLAADQVPDARAADQAAVGFLTLGRWFAGALPDVIDDQIDVVTRGLLGLSVQCARCHDHKYDPISAQDYYSLYGLFAAARMPVDGSGTLAELPVISPRPIEAVTEQEIATLRGQADEFLQTRLTALRNEFRTPEKLREYLLAAEGMLSKSDQENRAFAKSQGLDERIFQRWVRYLKNTTRNPHPVFAPWHALAAIPAEDFARQASVVIEKEKSGKLNRHVVALLTPTPESLSILAERYIELFLKHDGPEKSNDFEIESLRQVLGSNDSPPQVSLGELSQFLSADELKSLVAMRRNFLLKLATLPAQADHFLTYQHEAAPLLAELNNFLKQRRIDLANEIRSPEKIASYLLTAHEAESVSESKLRSLAKSRQLSDRQLRRWQEFLQQHAQQKDSVFTAWRIFTAASEQNFSSQSVSLAQQARNATANPLVAKLFATPPTSLSDVAKRYAELLAHYRQPEPFDDTDSEAIRQVALAEHSPLRFSPDDVVDYFTQKDLDELRNKERNLARLYLESPGVSPRAMSLQESARGYSQRVFVRGNSNIPGEPTHGGFLAVLSPKTPRPFQPGRGRLDLAEAIVDPQNPLAARVIVNRVWQWHFGTGLVRTPSDFGTRGTAPSHPELLDWLAQWFVAEGWSLKKLHRLILNSATWQQASDDNPVFRTTDPENHLLWRMNRRRLSFEELRDSMLMVSGQLDEKIGGRPIDLVKNNVRRRTVFGTVDRVALPGFYRYFDFPGADVHVPERHETIVAQQSLYLMNNAFVMDQASHAAKRVTAMHLDPAGRIEALYRQILGRPPSAEERSLSLEFTRDSTEHAAHNNSQLSHDPWRYGWGSYDESQQRVSSFELLPFFGNNQWKGGPLENDPELGRVHLNSRGGFAGPSNQQAVIRRWIAPRSGRLSISGLLSSQMNSTQPLGDGVRARIVASRQGQLGVWIVYGTEVLTNVPVVEVEPGDTIDFVTDARGRELHGTFTWSPVLKMEPATADKSEKTVWDAAKDFSTKVPATVPPAFGVWDRYAPVLLEANEFVFID